MKKSKCCSAFVVEVGEPPGCYHCMKCGKACEMLEKNKLSDRAHLFDEEKTEIEVLQEQVMRLQQTVERLIISVKVIEDQYLPYDGEWKKSVDRQLQHHFDMHKDHYANNLSLKENLQLVVQAQDAVADHGERIEVLQSDLGKANDDVGRIDGWIGDLSERIESLEMNHHDNKNLESEVRCNIAGITHNANRIEALDKKFQDTWMNNLPVKTANIIDRIESLEKSFICFKQDKDSFLNLIDRIEKLEETKTVYLKIDVAKIE